MNVANVGKESVGSCIKALNRIYEIYAENRIIKHRKSCFLLLFFFDAASHIIGIIERSRRICAITDVWIGEKYLSKKSSIRLRFSLSGVYPERESIMFLMANFLL